ncbi:MAG: hypothetical protein MGF17_09220 [Trichodesmium sp. MAG_R04]|nr:hypothetical protein [Trichodesmium sp. MAG_R04]
MLEEQPNQPNSEKTEIEPEAISQEIKETSDLTSETQAPEQPISDNELVAAKSELWQQVLRLVRSLLPKFLNKKLSDKLLTGAIAGIVALLLVVIFVSFPPSQDLRVTVESELTEPIVLEESLPPSIDSKDSEISYTALQQTPKSTEQIIPPTSRLTPEQIFLVSIQNQIDNLANQYHGGIVKSLKFNFSRNLLIAELNNTWYSITQEEQDELVNEMFEEAQDLDFKKLTLINSQGRMVAHTAVVSSKMIILERSLLNLPG